VPREREAVPRDRVDADDFERDEPPEARDEPLRDPLAEREDPLAFGFEREPLDELPLLCPLRGADLLAAIRDIPLIQDSFLVLAVPICVRNNPYARGLQTA
jgi:hypothetical protein